MAARTPLSTSIRTWKCPQCRSISTSRRLQAVGPEHPRYVELPEPPQQGAPYKPFIKGRLPVPRNIFSNMQGRDPASDEEIAKRTPLPTRQVEHPRGSREAWKQKMSAARRESLREGLKSLRDRTDRREAHLAEKFAKQRAEREEAVNRPEREDERLTTPSTGLDVQKLLHGPLEDPTREARLAFKARNLTLHTQAKHANRMDNLHTLYMHARHFIVNPAQLDSAIDEEFGTPERPRQFGDVASFGSDKYSSEMTSMWVYGRPASVQDMLDAASRGALKPKKKAMDQATGSEGVVSSRVRRIAEKLTGGKLE